MQKFLMGMLAVCLFAVMPARAEIVVAAVGPMTGQDAAMGEQLQRGVEAAADAINEAGGVLGQKVRIIVKDDACDPKQGVAVANSLAGAKVAGVIGPICSGVAIPVTRILNEEGIVMISPAATNPMVTDQRFGNIFRVCGRDDQQGVAIGQYMAKQFTGTKIAILHDKTAFGHGLAEETKKSLRAAGIKEIVYDAVNRGEKDFSALISRLREANIEIIFFGGYHPEAGLLVRQIHDRGLKMLLVGGDGLTTNEFWTITGKAGEGTLMAFAPDPRKNPSAEAAVTRLRGAGFEPEGYTLQSYAALEVLAQAIARAGKIGGAAIAKTIHAGEFPTVMGALKFDAKGDVTNPQYAMYRWSEGTYHEIEEK